MKSNILKRILKIFIGASHQETYNNCQHVFDQTYVQPAYASLPCWNNVHGYKLDNENIWYAAVDMRCCGIRVQNIVVRCNTIDKMNSWIISMKYSPNVIDRARNAGWSYRGSQINTCYKFNCTDGSNKNYNITDTSNFYVKDDFESDVKNKLK